MVRLMQCGIGWQTYGMNSDAISLSLKWCMEWMAFLWKLHLTDDALFFPPESSYQTAFRNFRKNANQTYTQFASNIWNLQAPVLLDFGISNIFLSIKTRIFFGALSLDLPFLGGYKPTFFGESTKREPSNIVLKK